jgi:hypothetical protein
MATEEQVRKYLAYWFQLGKKVVINNGTDTLLPDPIYQNNDYSLEFERCWEIVTTLKNGSCYIEGTQETIAELLTEKWEVMLCSRCTMPVPAKIRGTPPETCPCTDLPSWPNLDVPQPRSAVDSSHRLEGIRDRLLNYRPKEDNGSAIFVPNPDLAALEEEFPRCECLRPEPVE